RYTRGGSDARETQTVQSISHVHVGHPEARRVFLSPIPRRLTIGSIAKTSRSVAAQTRADAFARLFEAVREGVFIGALAPSADGADSTLAPNPHLQQIC